MLATMDLFAFYENRELDLEDLFSENANKDYDIIHLFRKLGHVRDKGATYGGLCQPWKNI